VVFDNLSRGHREAVRWGPLAEGDLADRNRLAMALETHQVAAVMHFAAYAYVGESVADPAMYYRNNLGGSLSLIEAIRETGVDKIVFSSTCATYGPGGRSDPRKRPAAASQPIWRDQAGDRAGTTLVRRGLWSTLGFAALLQCCRS
jgi:UDP-glucose 4-epimerase